MGHQTKRLQNGLKLFRVGLKNVIIYFSLGGMFEHSVPCPQAPMSHLLPPNIDS